MSITPDAECPALPMSPSLEVMAERVLAASRAERRTLVAIAGPPAAGKSTLAEALCARIDALRPGYVALVPMDGYHFDNAVLIPQGQLDIKGAPETFDVAGLSHDLARLRRDDGPVAVPLFDRPLDLARARRARLIQPGHRLVLVEGNYLLLDRALARAALVLRPHAIHRCPRCSACRAAAAALARSRPGRGGGDQAYPCQGHAQRPADQGSLGGAGLALALSGRHVGRTRDLGLACYR
ncbi:hypothetical protein [Salinicola tamaricis]|uniref:hypothetical protein n=1 Tax=Salinicola tamaricis TaxID=1771309 RepID=UPI0030F3CF46